jgi:hypothetical protein
MAKVPTKKTASKATKPAAVKKTAVKKAAVKKAVTKTATPKKTVANKAVVKKAATVKQAAPKKVAVKKAAVKRKPVVTTVIAKIDAGFGNQLYIRGGSSGLTWDVGDLMSNASANEWVWKSTSVSSELEFKVLINDETWSAGPNGVVFPGATVVFEPVF